MFRLTTAWILLSILLVEFSSQYVIPGRGNSSIESRSYSELPRGSSRLNRRAPSSAQMKDMFDRLEGIFDGVTKTARVKDGAYKSSPEYRQRMEFLKSKGVTDQAGLWTDVVASHLWEEDIELPYLTYDKRWDNLATFELTLSDESIPDLEDTNILNKENNYKIEIGDKGPSQYIGAGTFRGKDQSVPLFANLYGGLTARLGIDQKKEDLAKDYVSSNVTNLDIKDPRLWFEEMLVVPSGKPYILEISREDKIIVVAFCSRQHDWNVAQSKMEAVWFSDVLFHFWKQQNPDSIKDLQYVAIAHLAYKGFTNQVLPVLEKDFQFQKNKPFWFSRFQRENQPDTTGYFEAMMGTTQLAPIELMLAKHRKAFDNKKVIDIGIELVSDFGDSERRYIVLLGIGNLPKPSDEAQAYTDAYIKQMNEEGRGVLGDGDSLNSEALVNDSEYIDDDSILSGVSTTPTSPNELDVIPVPLRILPFEMYRAKGEKNLRDFEEAMKSSSIDISEKGADLSWENGYRMIQAPDRNEEMVFRFPDEPYKALTNSVFQVIDPKGELKKKNEYGLGYQKSRDYSQYLIMTPKSKEFSPTDQMPYLFEVSRNDGFLGISMMYELYDKAKKKQKVPEILFKVWREASKRVIKQTKTNKINNLKMIGIALPPQGLRVVLRHVIGREGIYIEDDDATALVKGQTSKESWEALIGAPIISQIMEMLIQHRNALGDKEIKVISFFQTGKAIYLLVGLDKFKTENFLEKGQRKLQEAKEKAEGKLSKTVDTVKDEWKNAVDTGKQKWNEAVDTGKQKLDEVAETGKQKWNEAVDTGKDILNEGVNLGNDIIEQGRNVVDTGKKIFDNGKEFVKGAKDEAKNAFKKVKGIFSW